MIKRFVLAGLALALGLGLVLVPTQGGKARAQGADEKKLVWKHGLKFQVRKAGEKEFTDKTQQYGAEIFQDKLLNQLVYIAEKGDLSLGSAANADSIGTEVKAPKLFYALELTVREVGESKFEGKVKKYGIEVFNDPNANNIVYVAETGKIAVIPTGTITAPASVKNPEWFHGLEVKVRKAGESDFEKAMKVSLEVYKDEHTNRLIYVTDAGAIATVDAAKVAKPKADDIKNPTWYHAFDLKVRPADEDKFTDKAKKFGVEVYKDENADTLLFVSETGSIAVVPAGGVTKPAKSADPKLEAGRAFSVRKANEPNFTEKTQKFGAEIYTDPNSNTKVYVPETGALFVTK